MKAVEVVEKELKLIDFPRPEPGPDEVLIKVKATAVNRADLMQKNGLLVKKFVKLSYGMKDLYW